MSTCACSFCVFCVLFSFVRGGLRVARVLVSKSPNSPPLKLVVGNPRRSCSFCCVVDRHPRSFVHNLVCTALSRGIATHVACEQSSCVRASLGDGGAATIAVVPPGVHIGSTTLAGPALAAMNNVAQPQSQRSQLDQDTPSPGQTGLDQRA